MFFIWYSFNSHFSRLINKAKADIVPLLGIGEEVHCIIEYVSIRGPLWEL